jgi:hypothetical protein
VDEILLIAGVGDPVIADYASWAMRSHKERVTVLSHPSVCGDIKECVELHSVDNFSRTEFLSAYSQDRITQFVIFLSQRITTRERELLDIVASLAIDKGVECICIVSSFRVHLGDTRAIEAEEYAVNRFEGLPAGIVVIRPSHVLSLHSRVSNSLRKYHCLAQALPSHLTTCFVEGEELFAMIDSELLVKRRPRTRGTYTLLGANTGWKALLARKQSESPSGLFARLIAALLRFFLIGHLLGWLVVVLAKWVPSLRPCTCGTLYPISVRELLALYNKYNYRNIKIVGYNNGVIHFGHKYPGKTIISTIRCNHAARVMGGFARFDGGVTVRQAMEVLKEQGKELHVIPNYTYVSMGTAYFIPIHGSACDNSTIGETIQKVLLYDPINERFIAATRKNPTFGHYMYNLAADVLLLRLTVRAREKTRYYVKILEQSNPSSKDLLRFFQGEKPSNVEIRKAKASSDKVKVSLYYAEDGERDTVARELPRDALGRLWDRLESNPITSFLFHGLVRWLAHHVELFLSESDFAIFWDTHRALPLSKIQLRYIKRDGLPHSPFREHDCVSADLFMLKKHKKAFEAYLRETLPGVAMNPGKHSR